MERKLSRRNILGAAGAFAGGSTLAGAATAAAPVIGAVTASDGDALTLSLLRQWIAASREWDRQNAAFPNQESYPAGDLMTELEDRVFETPGGAVALAIKTLFRLRNEYAAWSDETRFIRIEEAFDDEPGWDIEVAVSLLSDAAAIVPEIAELAAPVVHEDAAIIDAEMGIKWCRAVVIAEPLKLRITELTSEEQQERHEKWCRGVEEKRATLFARVARAEPKTARGRTIKARLLGEGVA